MEILITQAVSSICNPTRTHKRLTLFLFTSLCGWRQVTLDLGVHAVRECVCTHVHVRASHCSLQLRVTSRVQTMSFRFARLRILPIPLFLPYARSPTSTRLRRFCHLRVRMRIRAPTRFFLHIPCRHRIFCSFTEVVFFSCILIFLDEKV